MSTLAAPAATLASNPRTERELGGHPGAAPRRARDGPGRGLLLWDDEGRQYLDLTASYGVAPLGHAHPALLAAINDQAGRLIALSSNFFNDRRAELLVAAQGRAPENFVHFFLCNSGTEANEAALKFALPREPAAGLGRAQARLSRPDAGALATTWNPQLPRDLRAAAPDRDLRRCPATTTGSTAPSATRPRRSSPR